MSIRVVEDKGDEKVDMGRDIAMHESESNKKRQVPPR